MRNMVVASIRKAPARNSTRSKNGVTGHLNRGANMKSVFILWHTHKVGGESDEKLIGAYRSRKEAKAAISRLWKKPGFKDAPDGFEVTEYALGKDHWTEGY